MEENRIKKEDIQDIESLKMYLIQNNFIMHEEVNDEKRDTKLCVCASLEKNILTYFYTDGNNICGYPIDNILVFFPVVVNNAITIKKVDFKEFDIQNVTKTEWPALSTFPDHLGEGFTNLLLEIISISPEAIEMIGINQEVVDIVRLERINNQGD